MDQILKKKSKRIESNLEELRELFVDRGRYDDQCFNIAMFQSILEILSDKGLVDMEALSKNVKTTHNKWFPPPDPKPLQAYKELGLDYRDLDRLDTLDYCDVLFVALEEVRDPKERLRLYKMTGAHIPGLET
jgi:hypothetical protein